MIVKLTKNNIRHIPYNKTVIRIIKDDSIPEYVVEAMSTWKNVEFISEDEIDIPITNIPVLYESKDWPSKEEILNPPERTALIVPDNVSSTIRYVSPRDAKYITLNPIYKETICKMAGMEDLELRRSLPMNCWYICSILNPDLDEDKEYSLVQYCPVTPWSMIVDNYRRDILSFWITSHLRNARIIRRGTTLECNTLLISYPDGALEAVNAAIYKRLVYDRTDNWSAGTNNMNKSNDEWLCRNADVIFCSAQYLYDTAKPLMKEGAQIYLIENGGTKYNVTYKGDIDRYVYVGRHSGKIDYEWMNSLDKEVDLYGDYTGLEIEKYKRLHLKGILSEKEMVEELTHYQAGLVGFVGCDWTKGMFPIKLYNYVNAGLKVITHNSPETDLALKKYSREEILTELSWNKQFCKMMDCLGSMDDLTNNEIETIGRRFDDDTYAIWWSIGHKCNFNCSYCIQGNRVANTKDWKYNLSDDDFKAVCDRLALLIKNDTKYKKYRMSVIGGEPSLWDLHYLHDKLKETGKNVRLLICTNFAYRDKKWWEYFNIDSNLITDISVSTHIEQLKLRNISFDDFTTKASGFKHLRFKFIVNDDNWDEVQEFVMNYASPKQIRVQYEGMRDSKNFLINVGKEVRRAIRNNGDKQTDNIQAMKQLADNQMVKCHHRLSIVGKKIVKACKYPGEEILGSFLEVEELPELQMICGCANICNLCQVHHLETI